MTGIMTTVTDFFGYNTPNVWEYASCSEYAKADLDYWGNRFSDLALVIGIGTAGGSFIKNIHRATNLGKKTFESVVDGCIVTMVMKTIGYVVAGFNSEYSKAMCEEEANRSSFEKFTEQA